ncbi:MAG: NERD domain-containing protein [Alkalibacterium sp.]|nr:NERD domain-containing protein [Alkalibacterium sp.]
MIDKKREKPHALCVMESLSIRGALSSKERLYYSHLVKGYEGEYFFDVLVEKTLKEYILLCDLVFKVNGTIFQIDSLVVTNNKLYVYEVKNYEGEYQMNQSSLIRCAVGTEVLNPLIQLQRSTILFKQLLAQMNIKTPLESYIVYINQNFTLYQAGPHPQIILYSQLSTHFKSITESSKPLNEGCLSMSKLITSKNIGDSPYQDLPDYGYKTLKKGIYCPECFTFFNQLKGRMCICSKCGYRETAYANVHRHVMEFNKMLPDIRPSTKTIFDWCNGMHSMYRIRSVLRNEQTIE